VQGPNCAWNWGVAACEDRAEVVQGAARLALGGGGREGGAREEGRGLGNEGCGGGVGQEVAETINPVDEARGWQVAAQADTHCFENVSS
jgi:hypothetical protein